MSPSVHPVDSGRLVRFGSLLRQGKARFNGAAGGAFEAADAAGNRHLKKMIFHGQKYCQKPGARCFSCACWGMIAQWVCDPMAP